MDGVFTRPLLPLLPARAVRGSRLILLILQKTHFSRQERCRAAQFLPRCFEFFTFSREGQTTSAGMPLQIRVEVLPA